MEEISPPVGVPFKIGNLICEESAINSHIKISGLKLIANTANLLSESATKLPLEPIFSGDENGNCRYDLVNEGGQSTRSLLEETKDFEEQREELSKNVSESGTDIHQLQDNSDRRSVGADHCGNSVEESLEVNSEINSLISEDIEKNIARSRFSEPNSRSDLVGDLCVENFEAGIDCVAENFEAGIEVGSDTKSSTELPELPQAKKLRGSYCHCANDVDCVLLSGVASLCGERSEMEDAFVIASQILKFPVQQLAADKSLSSVSENLGHSTAHFLGVYDGHGGCQVANYCGEHIHLALAEEIGRGQEGIFHGGFWDNSQEQWEKAFIKCFLKIDAEIEPIAPETVGSTAVVAVICASHIIVANCGDSRAVLCRGKIAMPLSVDHKPDREDERSRIEAEGGRVIQWNGFRVCGVLAMSRSLGDRYLKPWVVPDPEVMVIPRAKEDECLILASDGLWDVMTNQEACDMARRRILLWHKKNGTPPCAERSGGFDPAAQDAADYLSKLALQKGSRDNVTVIVADLKARRKIKSRT
ncbi:PPM-type phosphatase-like domain [Dillenia turbinata]|uniref:protein-serine/threonine phosphatase n=1 Tax=Dillenia turbinata TaxID=194707 RepID=A0AAN8ZTK8_9MAGN